MLADLAEDLREYSVGPGPARPGLLVFVVTDGWQRELVFRVARSFGVERMVQVWCVDDGSVHGAREAVSSGGWVYQNPGMRDVGGWPWEDRLEDSLWAQGTGVGSNRLLGLVAEWPNMMSSLGRQGLRETGNSKWVLRLFRDLVSRGLVLREGTSRFRYRLTSRGYSLLAARDRVPNSNMLAGVRGPTGVVGRRMQVHEDGVMDTAGLFMEAGLPVAAGWRSWEGLEGGSIMPDGLAYVSEGPYGPGWHYLEYERYVRGRYRAERKLKGYLASDRREGWPLMLVVWNEVVEELFQGLARDSGLLMLTSTLGRVARFGPVGNANCWSMFDRPVYIGSWE